MDRERKQVINAGCACETKDGIWFVHYALSILMFYDFSEKKITRGRVIPNIENSAIAPFLSIMENKDKLYLFSCNASQCYIYNIVEDNFTPLSIENLAKNNFRAIYREQNVVYVIPYRYKAVVKVNLDTDSVTYSSGFQKLYRDSEQVPYINSSNRVDSEWIVNAVPYTNSFLMFNLKNESWKKIDTLSEQYSTIASYREKLYGFDFFNKRLVKLNLDGSEIKHIDTDGIESCIVYSVGNGWILVDETYGDRIHIYNENLELIAELKLDIIKGTLSTEYWLTCWFKGAEQVYGITKSNELIIIDQKNNITVEKLSMDADLWDSLSLEYIKQCKCELLESELTGLEAFINDISWYRDSEVKL